MRAVAERCTEVAFERYQQPLGVEHAAGLGLQQELGVGRERAAAVKAADLANAVRAGQAGGDDARAQRQCQWCNARRGGLGHDPRRSAAGQGCGECKAHAAAGHHGSDTFRICPLLRTTSCLAPSTAMPSMFHKLGFAPSTT